MRLLAEMLVALTLAVAGAIVFIEWMAGCGETYIDAKGKRHSNECLFINRP
jgi:hypothetical protein